MSGTRAVIDIGDRGTFSKKLQQEERKLTLSQGSRKLQRNTGITSKRRRKSIKCSEARRPSTSGANRFKRRKCFGRLEEVPGKNKNEEIACGINSEKKSVAREAMLLTVIGNNTTALFSTLTWEKKVMTRK